MTGLRSNFVIGWKVASLAFNMASVRYRAMLPFLALEEEDGFDCRVFSDSSRVSIEELDVLVIVKSFTADDYLLVQQAVVNGIPVVLDLCDNIFIGSYGALPNKSKTLPAQMFLAMARLSQAIVVTTEPLADVVRLQLNGKVPVYVIPDGIETQELLKKISSRLNQALSRQRKSFIQEIHQRALRFIRRVQILRSAALVPLIQQVAKRIRKEMHWKPWAKRAYRQFDKLRTFLKALPKKKSEPSIPISFAANPDIKRILWFGNHGAPHARFGMLDLLEIRYALETIATEFEVELVVVSNNLGKYQNYIKPLKISSRYIEWSPTVMQEQLSHASVVVIPNTRDPFSLCKSANRTVMALNAKIPVVATSTPALDSLQDCILFDNFLAGLRLYLTDLNRVDADVKKGKEIIEREFSQAAISSAWKDVFEFLNSIQDRLNPMPDAELIVALNLIQDLDLALPIILQAIHTRISVLVYCNTALLKKSSRVAIVLREHSIPVWLLPEDICQDKKFIFPPSAKIFLTVAETNLAPHRFTRQLTEAANAANLVTATLQHGFENVGLTYDDEYQSIDKINFAAKHIYLWGGLETLHPRVPSATIYKCVPIGCSKPAQVSKANLDGILPLDAPIVGVFENLHWKRYSDEYREFFIQNIQALARRFPEILFFIKPHHAGLWLTARFSGDVPAAPNIIIADPQLPLWETFTAPSLMGYFHAVITTPSTVALDAARQQLPVAVVAHKLQLPNYNPLPLICDELDWYEFVRTALGIDTKGKFIELANQFVDKTVLSDGAAERIVKDLLDKAALSDGAARHINNDLLECSLMKMEKSA